MPSKNQILVIVASLAALVGAIWLFVGNLGSGTALSGGTGIFALIVAGFTVLVLGASISRRSQLFLVENTVLSKILYPFYRIFGRKPAQTFTVLGILFIVISISGYVRVLPFPSGPISTGGLALIGLILVFAGIFRF